jgi:hypothetical protein
VSTNLRQQERPSAGVILFCVDVAPACAGKTVKHPHRFENWKVPDLG